MVEKFEEIFRRIREEKGDVTFFAIMKMDELTDKWSVVLSAPWANDENRTEVFEYIRNLLSEKLTPEERVAIARIGVFLKEHHSIQALLQLNQGTYIKEDTQINGFIVHEARVFASNPQI